MNAVQAETLNSIADYHLIEAQTPVPAPGEVLIKVASCGVGFADALVALGQYQVKPSLPHIPGSEVGGWVEAIGQDVEGFSPGERVMASVTGGFADFAIASAEAVFKIPARLTFDQAAGLRINYLTALHGLRDRATLRAGERLLVLGAAGGVGIAAVQVAKRLGAYVVAAASTEQKRAFVTAHGADAVLDTEPDGWRERLKAACGGRGPDVVFDPVCGPLFQPAFRSLAWGGRHLVVGFTGGAIPALPANLPLLKGAGLIGVDVVQFLRFEPERAAAHLAELLAWSARGELAPPVGRAFPMAQFAAALEFALSRAGHGKTVLHVGQGD